MTARRRRFFAGAGILLFPLLAGGCGTTAPAGSPYATGNPAAAETAARPEEYGTPSATEHPAIAEPARLIGLKAAEIADLLGAPSFRRKDNPAEIWQYRTQSCFVDVFLYADKAGGEIYAVAHVEARPRRTEPVTKQDCLRQVVREKRVERSG